MRPKDRDDRSGLKHLHEPCDAKLKQANTKRRTSNGELYATYHIIYDLFALVVGPASGCSLRGHTSDIRHPVPDMRFAARCEA